MIFDDNILDTTTLAGLIKKWADHDTTTAQGEQFYNILHMVRDMCKLIRPANRAEFDPMPLLSNGSALIYIGYNDTPLIRGDHFDITIVGPCKGNYMYYNRRLPEIMVTGNSTFLDPQYHQSVYELPADVYKSLLKITQISESTYYADFGGTQ
jgi:hypothetical protein